MFPEICTLQQEIKYKQARFQAQAAQERFAKACNTANPSGENPARPARRRPWLAGGRFGLIRQPK